MRPNKFSKLYLLITAVVFAVVGVYALMHVFAGTTCLVSNRSQWALGGTDCNYGTLINAGSTQWRCSQPLSNYGPLPIKVTWNFSANNNPDYGDQGVLDLINGCRGDGNSDTIDLIAYIPGDGRTFGSSGGAAKFRAPPGPNNLQVTGVFECGPIAPGSAAHQDVWQFQTNNPNNNLAIVNGLSGNWSNGTSTCVGAGGSTFWSDTNDINIYGGRYVTCNAGFRGGGQTVTGNVVVDAMYRAGRVDGSDPRCTPYYSAGPCVQYSNFTFANVTCGDWNDSQNRFIDQVINPGSSVPPPSQPSPTAPPPTQNSSTPSTSTSGSGSGNTSTTSNSSSSSPKTSSNSLSSKEKQAKIAQSIKEAKREIDTEQAEAKKETFRLYLLVIALAVPIAAALGWLAYTRYYKDRRL